MNETQKEKDIFDKIMSLPILRIFYPFYEKNKDILLYIFFGGVTTLADFGTYWILCHVFKINLTISNIIAQVCAIIVAFITNRIWVFHSEVKGVKGCLIELYKFSISRLTTMAINTAGMYLFCEILHYNDMLMKVLLSIIVLILNYVFSKFLVFNNKDKNDKKVDDSKQQSKLV